MTKAEARQFFGLKDTDIIHTEGLKQVMKDAEQLARRSISKATKEDCKRQIEACKALME